MARRRGPTSPMPATRRSAARSSATGSISCGDIGYLDADGYLYLNDRRSDMVISGGVNIYPAEIEACLLSLPGVRDCAVFGIPDEEFGEALAAHVELHEGAQLTAEEVARPRPREARRLQDAARGRVQRVAAARGLRQDLQAPPARALLARARARDLDGTHAVRQEAASRAAALRRAWSTGGSRDARRAAVACIGPCRPASASRPLRRPWAAAHVHYACSAPNSATVPCHFSTPSGNIRCLWTPHSEQRGLRAAGHRARLPAAAHGPREGDQTEPQAHGAKRCRRTSRSCSRKASPAMTRRRR